MERLYKDIINLIVSGATTYYNETVEDKKLDELISSFDIQDNRIYKIRFLDGYNSVNRFIKENPDESLSNLVKEASDMLVNLKEIKNIDLDLYNEYYEDWKYLVNSSISNSTGVRFEGGSIALKMFYWDLFYAYYMTMVDVVTVSRYDNSLSITYTNSNGGYFLDNPDYAEYGEKIIDYILNDPFEDIDKLYIGFTYGIYKYVISKLYDNNKKMLWNMMKNHFSIINEEEYQDGIDIAKELIVEYAWSLDEDLRKEKAEVEYSHLKIFYIFTEDEEIKKYMDTHFKMTLFTKTIKRK